MERVREKNAQHHDRKAYFTNNSHEELVKQSERSRSKLCSKKPMKEISKSVSDIAKQQQHSKTKIDFDKCSSEELIQHSREIKNKLKKYLTSELKIDIETQQIRFENILTRLDKTTRPDLSEDDEKTSLDDESLYSAKSYPETLDQQKISTSVQNESEWSLQQTTINNDEKIDKQLTELQKYIKEYDAIYDNMSVETKLHLCLLKTKVHIVTVLWNVHKTFLPPKLHEESLKSDYENKKEKEAREKPKIRFH